jgi:hypothetical protein
MQNTQRYNSVSISESDFEGAIGSIRQVTIDPFPSSVQGIRIYARAWGHWLGDDPDDDNNGFINKIIESAGEIIDEIIPSTSAKHRAEEKRAKLNGSTRRKALLLVWKNEYAIDFPNDSNQRFENYNLGPLDINLDVIPEPQSRFQLTAAHWNQWATEDGFEVFVELTI